jgi:hypothetical protein
VLAGVRVDALVVAPPAPVLAVGRAAVPTVALPVPVLASRATAPALALLAPVLALLWGLFRSPALTTLQNP